MSIPLLSQLSIITMSYHKWLICNVLSSTVTIEIIISYYSHIQLFLLTIVVNH